MKTPRLSADARTKRRFLTEFALFGLDAPQNSPTSSFADVVSRLDPIDLNALTRKDYPFLQFDPPTRRTPTLPESIAYCRRLTRSHYENFAVDGPVLPRRLRDPFCAVYAYCRWADDLGDELGDSNRSFAALDRWESELDAAFERSRTDAKSPQTSRFTHPVFIALTEVFRQFPQLPQKPFADLLKAFRLDQTRQNWASLADLEEYCRYSANPVGRIVLGLFLDAPTPRQLEYSDAICTGLQLANFWQDVARDAEIGRVYIPEDVRERNDGDFSATLRELVAETRRKFEFGRPLLATLPPFRLRVAISLFLEAGIAVLNAIERDGFRNKRPASGDLDAAQTRDSCAFAIFQRF